MIQRIRYEILPGNKKERDLKEMRLKTRLFLGLSGLFIILLLISGSAIYQMKKLNNTIEGIVKDDYQKVQFTATIQFEINNASRYLRDLILEENNTTLETYKKMEKSNKEIRMAISNLEKVAQDDALKELTIDIKTTFDEYLQIEKSIYDLVQSGNRDEAKNVLYQDSSVQTRSKLVHLLEEIAADQKQGMDSAMVGSKEVYNRVIVIFTLLVFVGMVLGGSIVFWLIRDIAGNLSRVTIAMKGVSSYQDKTSLPRLDIASRDEIGEISEVFNNMAEALEQHVRQEKERNLAIQEQHWLKSKIAEIMSLFQGVQDVKNFAQLIISRIPPMVGANYGVFYISVGEGHQQRLVKAAAYASDGQEVGTASFAAGEGLVGQCLLENKAIYLRNIPDQYIRITSGLGTAPARCITLLPVEFGEKVMAVMELASFTELSFLQQELLEQVRWNIGIALNRILSHMQVQKLLAESQALTEELQTQSEELKTQSEELKTFNERIENQYKESEQKALELQKAKTLLEEQAKQLALSSQYKSQFLSNMSHELRTPLNSLLILADIFVQNKEGNLTPRQIEYGKTILAAGNDLLALINDILDLARIEAGKLNIKPEMISLDKLVKSIKNQFDPVAHQKKLDFTIELDQNLPKIFFTDEHRLMQILKNLLSNAFKFTHEGCIGLKIQRTSGTSEQLAFSVSDTGIGIAEEEQELIFQSFHQADSTTSRKFGGTGLGLYICRLLTRLLGGYIELQSSKGKGSTFTIYIPPYVETDRTEVAAAVEIIPENKTEISKGADAKTHNFGDKPLKGHKVLVVDDDMRNIFAITAALEEQEMEVLFAENGREAQSVLLENPGVGLVLMDIMMPEMDGYEAMQAIRQMAGYEELPIIALTAKAMKDDRSKCLQAGASDYISKPLNINQLVSLMKVWLYR
ncbi:ATP-binding protein [Desulfotomaculum sp. 1211_IL3151]|uniref:ATP-binding protein n=1 Tax=Desulfotomaculum sp. 1211_IL3151 TaxID=3084055 RepID=UPI002FD88E55